MTTTNDKRPIRGAVLLAAGRGARLKPFTDKTPKPLLPVNGAPTLDLYFSSLATAGVENVVLVVHHLAEQIENYSDNVESRFGINCTTVRQKLLDGTATALEAVSEIVIPNNTDAGHHNFRQSLEN